MNKNKKELELLIFEIIQDLDNNFELDINLIRGFFNTINEIPFCELYEVSIPLLILFNKLQKVVDDKNILININQLESRILNKYQENLNYPLLGYKLYSKQGEKLILN